MANYGEKVLGVNVNRPHLNIVEDGYETPKDVAGTEIWIKNFDVDQKK